MISTKNDDKNDAPETRKAANMTCMTNGGTTTWDYVTNAGSDQERASEACRAEMQFLNNINA